MNQKTSRTKHYLMALVCIIISVAVDQWTKYLAVSHLKDQDPYIIIPDIFQLSYLENRGAAFGLFQDQKFFFFLSAVVILGVILWFYMKVPMTKKFLPLRICAAFIAAGAIGNLIDRIRLDYVVDFFYFEWIDFPVFNVADIFVTVSTIIFALLILFYYKEEDFDQILHHRNG